MKEKKIIKLADLAKELGVDPKVIRRELREMPFQRPGKRWEWPEDHPNLEPIRLLLKAKLKYRRPRGR